MLRQRLAESFVDSFKTELIADRVWRTSHNSSWPSSNTSAGSTTPAYTKRSRSPAAEFETLSQSSYGPTIPLMTKAGTN